MENKTIKNPQEKELIIIKLGGSIITDKNTPKTPNIDTLDRLSKEIKEAIKNQYLDIIICNGSGSYGHMAAKKYETQNGIINEKSYCGISEVHKDAQEINTITIESLKKQNLSAIAFHPSSTIIAKKGIIKEFYTKPLELMLKNMQIPVIYGDIAMDEEQGVCIISGDSSVNHLAKNLKAKKIIMVTKVDGVLDEKNEIIPEITKDNIEEIKRHLKPSESVDVTGGMIYKVEQMLELTEYGIQTEIINGNIPGRLKKAILKEDIPKTTIR